MFPRLAKVDKFLFLIYIGSRFPSNRACKTVGLNTLWQDPGSEDKRPGHYS